MQPNIENFIGCDSSYRAASIVLYGAPYDSTTSYRPGARFGPAAIRHESYGLETYSPYQNADLTDFDIFDSGDLELCFGSSELALTDIEARAEEILKDGKFPLLLGGEKPDFTFLPQRQYEGTNITQTLYPTCSELLEEFYRLKTGSEGVKLAGEGLRRQVTSIHERLVRKRAVRLQELEKSAGRDQLRLYGDLLSANLYRLEKGMTALTCEDYTADPPVNVTIPLEGRLTPSRNVQKYYTEYRKAANAEAVLRRLITECEEEIAYIESVQEALRRATTEGELLEIREELRQQGYLKTLTPKGQKPLQKRRGGTLPPLRYRSSDGYTILCGRNNLQNDQLTLKTAHGSDLWFHIQKQPGSHVILLTGGTPLEELPDQTIEEAAMLAACNSSGRESSRVPIDYTLVKNIKKPNGARPGMVIYETYYTMLTTPNHAAAQKLLEK